MTNRHVLNAPLATQTYEPVHPALRTRYIYPSNAERRCASHKTTHAAAKPKAVQSLCDKSRDQNSVITSGRYQFYSCFPPENGQNPSQTSISVTIKPPRRNEVEHQENTVIAHRRSESSDREDLDASDQSQPKSSDELSFRETYYWNEAVNLTSEKQKRSKFVRMSLTGGRVASPHQSCLPLTSFFKDILSQYTCHAQLCDSVRVQSPISPVITAVRTGDLRELLSHLHIGSNIDKAHDQDGLTALHWAAKLGNPVIVKAVVYYYDDLDIAATEERWTPLHLAAQAGHAPVCRILLEMGASPHKASTTGLTALHAALKSNHSACVSVLLKFGADANLPWKGLTPLSLAIDNADEETVDSLINAGADVRSSNVNDKLNDVHNDDSPYRALTSLQRAVVARKHGIVKTLLAHGASADAQTPSGLRALHLAVENGDLAMVELLLQARAQIELRGDRGFSPLHVAARCGHLKIYQTLLRYEAGCF